jgi:hypothetical protein
MVLIMKPEVYFVYGLFCSNCSWKFLFHVFFVIVGDKYLEWYHNESQWIPSILVLVSWLVVVLIMKFMICFRIELSSLFCNCSWKFVFIVCFVMDANFVVFGSWELLASNTVLSKAWLGCCFLA